MINEFAKGMIENDKILWGIDLGGTKVEGVVLRSEPIEVISRIRLPTERENGYGHIINQICKVIGLLKEETGLSPRGLGIGTPGILDPTSGLLKNSNTVVLNGKPFKKDLEQAVGMPIKMTNDANCFALAETKMGVVAEKCPEAKVVFGVILGTGVGGGIVFDGQIWNGRMGIGGEWGHNFLDHSGGECYCGKVGCVEKVIAGPAVSEFYKSLTGKARPLKDIYQDYEQGEAAAIKTIDHLLHYFGLAISGVINILDPDVIVLGGGVGNIDELYSLGVAETQRFLFNDKLETPILKPKLGDSAGVFGAAFLNLSK